MRPSEFQRARSRIESADVRLQDWLQVDEGTLDRWASGARAIPRRKAQQIRWLEQSVRNQEKLEAAELPECPWIQDNMPFDPESPPEDPDEHISLLRNFQTRVEEHERDCTICQRRNEWIERNLEDLPAFPGSHPSIVAVLEWFSARPRVIRYVLGGALAAVALAALRFAGVLIGLVIDGAEWELFLEVLRLSLLAFALAAFGGGVAGLAVALVGPILAPLKSVGYYLTGALGGLAFAAAMELVFRVTGEPMIEDRLDLLILGTLAMLFGVAVAFGNRLADAKERRLAEVNRGKPGGRTKSEWIITGLTLVAAVTLIILGRLDTEPSAPSANDLERRIGSDSSDVAALAALANRHMEGGRYGEAADLLGRAVAVEPNNGGYRNDLGWALMQLGRNSEALPHLRKSVEIRPEHFVAWWNLGAALADLERFEEAVPAYRAAVQRREGDARLRLEFGRVLRFAGQAAEAIEQLKKARELEPEHYRIHWALADALKGSGELDSAMASYRRALELEPRNPIVWGELGTLAHLTGRHDLAVEAFQRADSLDAGYFNGRETEKMMWEASAEGRMIE